MESQEPNNKKEKMPTTKEIEVLYTVQFRSILRIMADGDGNLPTISDMISDINIPENETSKYVSCSMEVDQVTDVESNENIPEDKWNEN